MTMDAPDGTDLVNITAGTVDVTAGTVQVENATGTNLQVTLPQTLLASSAGTATSVSVTPPAGCTGLLILIPATFHLTVSVNGNTTSFRYPTHYAGSQEAGISSAYYCSLTEAAGDSSFTVTISSAPGATWYVVADSAVRQVSVLDDARAVASGMTGSLPPLAYLVGGAGVSSTFNPLPVSQPGSAQENALVQVGGSDGTDVHLFATDTNGNQIAVGAAAVGAVPVGNPVYVAGWNGTDIEPLLVNASGALQTASGFAGTPGAAVPAFAAQVGGSDGTDLRTLATNTSGQLQVIDETLAPVVGTPGSAAPATGLIIGGTDGTDYRQLAVNSTGQVQVLDETLINAVGTTGSATPTKGILIGGTDGTDLRGVATDASGRLILPPATSSATGTVTLTDATSSAVLAATPTAALTARSWELSVVLGAITVTTAGWLRVTLEATTGPIVIASVLIWLPLTASFPAAGESFSLTGTCGDGGLTVPASATGDFTIAWTITTAVITALTGFASATILY